MTFTIKLTSSGNRDRLASYISSVITEKHAYAESVNLDSGSFILIHESDSFSDVINTLLDMAKYGCSSSVSRVFHDLFSIYDAKLQTDAAFKLGHRRNPKEHLYLFDEYLLDYILYNGIVPFSPETICSEDLLILKRFDNTNGTALYETLDTWFHCWFNSSESARKLYIHRSTFLDRLKKVEDLLKIDLSNDKTRLTYLLSFLLIDDRAFYFTEKGDIVYRYKTE